MMKTMTNNEGEPVMETTTTVAEKQPGACGHTCEVWSRVVGYYRPVSGWNPGKKEEHKERKTFKLTEAADGGAQ